MIYKLKLKIFVGKTELSSDYYIFLGAVYNLIGENIGLKNTLLSVFTKRFKDILELDITIFGKDNFNQFLNIFQYKKNINLNGNLFDISSIDLALNYFEDENFLDFNFVDITFLSPTIVKKELNGIDINQVLPISEVFITSAVRKYDEIFEKNLDIGDIKEKINNNVFVVKLDNIHTKIVKFKQATKAGVIGKVRYCLMKGIDSETKKVVYNALKLATFTGLGTGNKMGLGKISVYFSN